jgi:hypothetical protein
MTLVQLGHMPPPETDAPGMFALGEPARISELVTGAGFGEPEREEIAFEFRYLDFDDLWNALLRMSPSGRTIDELSAEEQRATVEAVRKNVAPYRNEDGSYSSPAATWGVLAS